MSWLAARVLAPFARFLRRLRPSRPPAIWRWPPSCDPWRDVERAGASAGYRWNGDANADPIANLHAAMERSYIAPCPPIVLSPVDYARARILLPRFFGAPPFSSYRARSLAVERLRYEVRRYRRGGPAPDGEAIAALAERLAVSSGDDG